MLAQLQQRSGDRGDAVESYLALSAALTARGAANGSMVDAVRAGLRRLRSQ